VAFLFFLTIPEGRGTTPNICLNNGESDIGFREREKSKRGEKGRGGSVAGA
jgi:hypothetical protein